MVTKLKLYYSTSSPFARKVLITAILTGQRNQIELIDFGKTGIFNPDYDMKNPLGKIPALEISPDNVMIDSPIICEYLNFKSTTQKIFAEIHTEAYFGQKKIEALADGLMDAAVLRRYEVLRPKELFSTDFDQKQAYKIGQSLHYFESNLFLLKPELSIAEISVLCALAYLDFRFPNENWRTNHAGLAQWFEKASLHPAFQATKP